MRGSHRVRTHLDEANPHSPLGKLQSRLGAGDPGAKDVDRSDGRVCGCVGQAAPPTAVDARSVASESAWTVPTVRVFRYAAESYEGTDAPCCCDDIESQGPRQVIRPHGIGPQG